MLRTLGCSEYGIKTPCCHAPTRPHITYPFDAACCYIPFLTNAWYRHATKEACRIRACSEPRFVLFQPCAVEWPTTFIPCPGTQDKREDPTPKKQDSVFTDTHVRANRIIGVLAKWPVRSFPLRQSHPAEVFMHCMIRVTILGDCCGHTQPKPHPKPQTSSPKSLISSPRAPTVEAKHPPQRLIANLGVSQIGGGFWEVPVQSVVVYWGLFGVSPFRETTISDVRIIGFHGNMERRGLQHRQYRAMEFNGAWFPIFLPKLTAHLYAQQPSNGTLKNHNRKPTLQNPTPRSSSITGV